MGVVLSKMKRNETVLVGIRLVRWGVGWAELELRSTLSHASECTRRTEKDQSTRTEEVCWLEVQPCPLTGPCAMCDKCRHDMRKMDESG